MIRSILRFCIFVFLCSCGGPRYVDFFPVYDDGTPKPQVVLMPLRVPEGCPENLDKELLSDIRYIAMDRNDLYLFPESDVKAWRNKYPNVDIYGREIGWCKAFKGAEFVAIVEAIDLSAFAYPCGCNTSYRMIKLRLKLIDIRCEEPKVILFELLENTQRIACLKPEKKSAKPMDVSYRGEYRLLVERVVDRLEKVIWSVK